jgi:hypothetical protein
MSYYILPKNNNNIYIEPNIGSNDINIYTSYSLYNFYNESKNQLKYLIKTDESVVLFKNLLKIINPYEYVFSNIPGFKYSISKLNTKSSLFYDLLEIFHTLNILDSFYNKNLKSLHISENYIDSNYSIDFFRENQKNEHVNFEYINEEIYNTINEKRYDFIFYEISSNNFENLNYYILNICQILMILLKYQCNDGVCLIKINHIFYKPIIDILYILSSLYEKVYIIKPNSSNITTFDKYIICKNFILNPIKKEIYKNYYFRLAHFISLYSQKNNNNDLNILSILNHEIPSYFINKIDDINIIIGQQQLESIDQIINILKNKNKEEKIESIKKSNIQKSVIFCEKYKIPHNKMSEKVNIFLSFKKEKNDVINDSVINTVNNDDINDVIVNDVIVNDVIINHVNDVINDDINNIINEEL